MQEEEEEEEEEKQYSVAHRDIGDVLVPPRTEESPPTFLMRVPCYCSSQVYFTVMHGKICNSISSLLMRFSRNQGGTRFLVNIA